MTNSSRISAPQSGWGVPTAGAAPKEAPDPGKHLLALTSLHPALAFPAPAGADGPLSQPAPLGLDHCPGTHHHLPHDLRCKCHHLQVLSPGEHLLMPCPPGSTHSAAAMQVTQVTSCSLSVTCPPLSWPPPAPHTGVLWIVRRENMLVSPSSAMETPGRSIFSSTRSRCFRCSFRIFFFFLQKVAKE